MISEISVGWNEPEEKNESSNTPKSIKNQFVFICSTIILMHQ